MSGIQHHDSLRPPTVSGIYELATLVGFQEEPPHWLRSRAQDHQRPVGGQVSAKPHVHQ
jgi:hypothetical protein